MCPQNNKMQLRAEILLILNHYSSNSKTIDNERFKEDIKKLQAIEDKDFLAQLLFKELLSNNKDYADICSSFALSVLSKELFQSAGLKILENPDIPDVKKFYFISLLEHKGVDIDYENLDFYISNPVEVSNEGIKEFLYEALVNPEARIDLLDFFNNISNEERYSLLNSLLSEYRGNTLYNILNVLTYANLGENEIEQVAHVLLKSDSYYSFCAAKNILKKYKLNNSLQLKLRTYVKSYKTKYLNKSDSKLLNDSVPYLCYMSFVDGGSNFSLIFTRKHQDAMLSTFFLTVNIKIGITSCIGFYKIEEDYFNKMTRRLFIDSLPVRLNPFEFREILEYFASKNTSNDVDLPYEYNVWKELTGDISYKGLDIYSYIVEKLPITTINKIKFEKISKSKLIENWYFEKGQNQSVDKIFSEINSKHANDINTIDIIIKKHVEGFFLNNNDIIDEIKKRLILQSYCALMDGFSVSSSVLYGIVKNQKYLKEIIVLFIYKSVYMYINDLLDDSMENIFKKKDKTKYSKKELMLLKAQIDLKFSGNNINGN